uniref:3-hydroxyisobutyrate dehydrogenase-like NAD-binding domain-containing protein n=2 Tax=Hemiselmis andersenii TaxID=464988 RepID=A0A7S0Y2Y1_HEMAN|mmetsp:Transcript_40352/g.93639  ORF Transcript_40352/g.93639 Transcript_40352/m.93639 type:complete len:137 (+) Transcript_40352:191-601(+)
MGKKQVFLGKVGKGAEMKLVVNMVMSTMLSSLSEGLALSEACGLKSEDVLDVMMNGAVANPMFALKGPLMSQGKYPTAFPLKHAQKDLRLALLTADREGLALPVAAASNEQYKRVKGMGRGDDDFCAVHAPFVKKG